MPGIRLGRMTKPTLGTLALAACAACGAVSEERVATLEAQLAQLQEQAQSARSGADTANAEGGGSLSKRVAALESNSTDSAKKIEEMLDVLQREVTRLASEDKGGEGEGSADAVSAAVAQNGSTIWSAVEAILGIPVQGVTADGNNFTVKRGWLMQEVRALAVKGKGPKLAPAKAGGVQIRGVKPKSLPHRLGLRNGDVIISVGDASVKSTEELVAALRQSDGSATLKVMRKKKETELTYTLAN